MAEAQNRQENRWYGTGRRKSAVARAAESRAHRPPDVEGEGRVADQPAAHYDHHVLDRSRTGDNQLSARVE